VLVELGAVEQRYRAVLEVLDEGVWVTEVARGTGWCGRRCTGGGGGADRGDAAGASGVGPVADPVGAGGNRLAARAATPLLRVEPTPGISDSVHHLYRADGATHIGVPQDDFESRPRRVGAAGCHPRLDRQGGDHLRHHARRAAL
jgi:hypothetical protein